MEGSQIRYPAYTIKLEGARLAAYRTFVLAGIRDPLLISKLDEVEAAVKESVRSYYSDIDPATYQINFYHYGTGRSHGRIGARPHAAPRDRPDVRSHRGQSGKSGQPRSARPPVSCDLHYGYPGRKSTAGNLAFPFAPSDVSFGAVYAFSVYHLMAVSDPTEFFPAEWVEVSAE